MTAHLRFFAEQEDRLVSVYLQGVPLKDIQKEFGMPATNTIYRALCWRGIERNRATRLSLAVIHRSEFLAYCNARLRCTEPKNKSYRHYGGRGIRFLFNSFAQFFQLVGPRPSGYVLDRRNNDGHYEPGNVRWITAKESRKNSRGGRHLGSKNKPKIPVDNCVYYDV